MTNASFLRACRFESLSARPCILALTVATATYAGNAYSASPTAVNDSRTLSAGGSLTINVLANDFDPDGDNLRVTEVLSPRNGSVSINSDSSIRYTPDEGFTGSDSFTYFIEDVSDQPAIASAEVTISVTSTASLVNPESNSASVANTLTGACGSLQEVPVEQLTTGQQQLLQSCLDLAETEIENPESLDEIARQISPEETTSQLRTSTNASQAQTNAIRQRVSLVRQNAGSVTFNGQSLGPLFTSDTSLEGGAAGDVSSPWSRLGIFFSAQQDTADKDQTDLETGYEYDGNTLTVGLDYLVSPSLILGAAAGWTQSDTEYANAGGDLSTDIYSFVGYGTWFKDTLSLSLQVGYGSIEFDSRRNIRYSASTPVDLTATGFTSGDQWLANGEANWLLSFDALTVSPFLRFDYVSTQIDGYGENGAEGFNMELGEQSVDLLSVSTGAQTTYAFSQSWGVLVPHLNLRMLSEVSGDISPVTGRFAFDPDPNNTFVIESDDPDSLYFQWGLGVSAVLKGGLSIFTEYQQLLGRDNLEASQIQAGLRYEL